MGIQRNIAWKTSGRDHLRYGYDTVSRFTSKETENYISRELSRKMGQITANAAQAEIQLLDLYDSMHDPALGHK